MKIVSSSSKYDGIRWIASIANERKSLPLSIGFHSFVEIPEAEPSEVYDFESATQEEDVVMNALRLGWPVRIHRTRATAGLYSIPRYVTSIEYNENNTDELFTVNSKTASIYDTLDVTIKPDIWPVNLCKVHADGYTNPAMYIGSSYETGLYTVPLPRIKCGPGRGFTISHVNQFVASVAMNEGFAEDAGVFEVTQPAIYDGSNKHHILPTDDNHLTVSITSDIDRVLSFSPDSTILEISVGSGSPTAFTTGKGYAIEAGTTTVTFWFDYDKHPNNIKVYATKGDLLWTIVVPQTDFSVSVEYQTIGGTWVEFGTRRKANVAAVEPIMTDSEIRVVYSNLITDGSAHNCTLYNFDALGNPTLVDTGANADGLWYPLGLMQAVSASNLMSYAYRYTYTGALAVNSYGVRLSLGLGSNFCIISIPGA